MKKSVVLAAALMILLTPVVVSAQDGPTTKVICKETVELSDEQSAKLSELKLEHQMASIKLGAELEVLQLEMQQALSKDDPSRKELELLVSKIGAAKEKLQKNRIEHLLQLKKILKPEQWRQMARCFGSMGDHGFMETRCMEIGRCDTGGHCSMGTCCAGAGQRGTVKCMSVDRDCCGTCGGRSACGSFCSGGASGCTPEKSSCRDIERRIEIRCEE